MWPPCGVFRFTIQSIKLDNILRVTKAGEEVRTLDNDVGNVVLYQLSYARRLPA